MGARGGFGKPACRGRKSGLGSGGGLQVGGRAQQVGLPGEEQGVEAGGIPAQVHEHAARSDEGGVEFKSGGDRVAVRLDAVLATDFGCGEVDALAAGPSGQGRGIAAKSLAESGGEGGGKSCLAFAEIDLSEHGFGGVALLDGEGDVDQEIVVADFEGRGVELLGPAFPPVPDRVQDGEAATAEAIGGADSPGVFFVARKTQETAFDLAAALLVEPIETAEGGELAGE